jgi:hypothetical protein
MSIGCYGVLLGVLYFWVGFAVFKRRQYIWHLAVACAGIGLFALPMGTIFGLLLLSNLFAARHDFVN